MKSRYTTVLFLSLRYTKIVFIMNTRPDEIAHQLSTLRRNPLRVASRGMEGASGLLAPSRLAPVSSLLGSIIAVVFVNLIKLAVPLGEQGGQRMVRVNAGW